MKNCFLCQKSAPDNEAIDVNTTKIKSSTVADIIAKHLQFIGELPEDNNIVCETCWVNVRDFHEFYETVKQIYEESKENIKEFVEDLHTNNDNTQLISEVIKCEEQDEDMKIEPQNSDDDVDNDDDNIAHSKTPEESPKPTNLTNICSRNLPDDEEKIRNFTSMLCDICDHSFNVFRDVSGHYMKKHGIKGYLVCCSKKFDKKCRLLDHINIKHFSILHKCLYCPKEFEDRDYLKQHTLTHTTIGKQEECNICSKLFTTNRQLKVHIRIHKKDEIEPTKECKECSKKFISDAKLKAHNLNKHSGATFLCQICSAVFKTKGNLKTHLTTHEEDGDNRFHCNICNHYLKKVSYASHMKRHKQGQHPCTHCDHICPNKDALASHIRYKHTPKSLSCNYCDKLFVKTIELKEHETIHLGIELYSCSICSKSFKNKSNMFKHRKAQHQQEYEKYFKPNWLKKSI